MVLVIDYRVNGGEWLSVSINAQSATWTFTVDDLQTNANQIEVQAWDDQDTSSGIVSRIITRSPESSGDGLIVHLKFDGDAYDAGENGNHGSVMGNTVLTTDRFGQADSAYGFDGNGDYILIPASPTLQISDALSVAAWVYLEDTGTYHCLAVQGTSFDTSGNWEIYIQSDGTLQLTKNNTTAYCRSDGAIDYGNWHHVAVTFSSGTARFYIDGVLDSVKAQSDVAFRMSSDWIKIGEREYAAGGGDLLGKLDDVRIYNRPLSDLEIRSIFQEQRGTAAMPWLKLLLLEQ
jgi:hypothetical protein